MKTIGLRPPSEISSYTCEIGVGKAELGADNLLILSILAGAFIAFAAEGSNMAAFNLLASPETYGLGRLIAGLVFPTGLILVVLAGGELFTGNILMGFALLERKIKLSNILKNWSLVYIGNFIGSILVMYMMLKSGLFNNGDMLLGGVTIKIAYGKANLSFVSAFYLGLMCNWLVCLAVWIGYSAKTVVGKIFGIFFPIWLFVASGFEHSIANMYYIPAGILAKANPDWALASGLNSAQLETINWTNFGINNLIPVTLGNIIGGLIFVGLAYWYVYLRKKKEKILIQKASAKFKI